MGSEDALSILQYRGYESWDDYAQQEGYKNQETGIMLKKGSYKS